MRARVIWPQHSRDFACALVADEHEERVAVLTGSLTPDEVRVEGVLEAINHHPDPANHFALGPRQWGFLHAQAKRLGTRVVGLLHSHPWPHEPWPSEDDRRMAGKYRSTLRVMALYHVETNVLIYFDESGAYGERYQPRVLALGETAASDLPQPAD